MYIYNLYVSWYLIYKLGPILRANLLVKRLDSTQLITPVTVGLMLAMLMIQMVILHLRFQLHSNFLNPTKTHIHIRSPKKIILQFSKFSTQVEDVTIVTLFHSSHLFFAAFPQWLLVMDPCGHGQVGHEGAETIQSHGLGEWIQV